MLITTNTKPTPELLRRIANTPDDGKTRRRYRWTVEFTIEVNDNWVADGFDMGETPEGLQDRLQDAADHWLSYAYGHEFSIKGHIIKAPDRQLIRAEQGYPVK